MNSYSDPELQAVVTLAVVIPCLIVGVAIQCLYLRSLSAALRECSERNRAMEPGHVWLNLIPLFGTVWMFVTVIRVADSLKAEFRDRGYREDGDFGLGLGIAYTVLSPLGVIPYLGSIIGMVGFALWVAYWNKVSGYRKTLTSGARYAEYTRRRPAFG